MIINYLKIMWRNLIRQKGFSFLNILGLAIGLACFLLIALFVNHELSYDTFHQDSGNIYRLGYAGVVGANEFFIANSPFPVGPAMHKEFPEIKDMTRVEQIGETFIKIQDQSLKEERFFYVEPNFFNFFNMKLKVGQAESVLADKNSVAISASQVAKYFGNTDPLGKTIELENGEVYKISGIAEDFPANSHFHFNFLARLNSDSEERNQDWFTNTVYTYLKMHDRIDQELLESKFPDFIAKNMGPVIEQVMGVPYEQFVQSGNRFSYFLQPLREIHLRSYLHNEIETNGSMNTVYIFSVIGLIILLIAGINFVNLSTARASRRASEVGIRKTLGSQRPELMKQFLMESFFLTLLSMILAFGMVEILLPWFNDIMGREVTTSVISYPLLLLLMLFITVLVAFMAGIYPAFSLSAFKPVEVLKGKFQSGLRGKRLRNGLVIFQFSAAIILFFSTYIINQQIDFMQNSDLGFKKDHIVVLNRATELGDKKESFRNLLLQREEIEQVSYSMGLPYHDLRATLFQADVAGKNESHALVNLECDLDFVRTYQIEILKGRYFLPDMKTDTNAIVLNEAAVVALSLKDPIGKQVMRASTRGNMRKYHIIGIMKNLHVESLQNPVRPAILSFLDLSDLNPSEAIFASVKIKSENVKQTISFIEDKWKEVTAGKPFEFNFFDDHYNQIYDREMKASELFTGFSVLAIFIATLGLLGLSAFMTEQRTKEIGIRKVLGASIGKVVILLVKEYFKWVILAGIVAFPFAWYGMEKWLQGYAYRIELHFLSFIMMVFIALIVATLTVSVQTIRAALCNPVKVLRYE